MIELKRTTRGRIAADTLSIVLSASGRGEMVEALNHELVHAVDHAHDRCKFSTCEGLVFSEVREARDAECDKHFYFELAKIDALSRLLFVQYNGKE